MTMITEDPEFLRAVLRDLMRDVVGMRAPRADDADTDHPGSAGTPGLPCLIALLSSLAEPAPEQAASGQRPQGDDIDDRSAEEAIGGDVDLVVGIGALAEEKGQHRDDQSVEKHQAARYGLPRRGQHFAGFKAEHQKNIHDHR
ncbi:hypothetical protein SAMN06265795_101234 [Noviherbaspirillum humi]|uniref:Uncharacterized protein n=1 Tax=Noviherbaspirillum humi TaxID=1688639 RepID=A0A239C4S0_9BURK|nr:hypothetical protein [Noviherbaspirillum humi]SNS14641.1 hypothetical protein SAMN06265795_101234 [Noviherbaspirillum humi]